MSVLTQVQGLVAQGRAGEALKLVEPLSARPDAGAEVLQAHATALKAVDRMDEAAALNRRAVRDGPVHDGRDADDGGLRRGPGLTGKLAVFDVDGTLVDSRSVIYRAAVEGAAAVGLPEPTYDAVRQIVGLTLHEALRVLEPALTDGELAEFVAAFQASFRAMHAEPGFVEPLYPGAAATLERLRREGWRVAMATGKSRRGVEAIVRMHGWADVFCSTHCADDGPGKPHPAMLLEALRASGAGAADAVMIGDTAHDMRMAVAAGVRPQGVSWGFHTADEVLAGGAVHVANDFDALNEALDRFAAATG